MSDSTSRNFFILLIALVTGFAVNFGGCSYRNVSIIRANAPTVWAAQGYDIIACEGYQIGNIFESPGGRVWYALYKKGDTRIRYTGFVTKWGDEFHVYNVRAIDAIGPQ